MIGPRGHGNSEPVVLVEISPLASAPRPHATVAEMLQLHERGIVNAQALRQWLGDLAGVSPVSESLAEPSSQPNGTRQNGSRRKRR